MNGHFHGARIFTFAIGANDRASSRLRVWDHIDWMRDEGATVISDSLLPNMREFNKFVALCRIVFKFPLWTIAFFRSDAILLQETLLLWPLLLFKRACKNRRVIFDFSDPVDRGAKSFEQRVRVFMFRQMIKRVDCVTVENPRYQSDLKSLATDIRQFYGPVDTLRYGKARERLPQNTDADRPVRIGWTGSPGTFKFIEPLIDTIDRVAKSNPIELVLVGAGRRNLTLRYATYRLIEWDEDLEYEVVPSFDFGLFRLEDTEDAKWRGAGKLFIYLSAGVPFIATHAGIAKALIKQSGLGFPVENDREWEKTIKRAISLKSERIKQSRDALKFAANYLSYFSYRRMLTEILVPNDTLNG